MKITFNIRARVMEEGWEAKSKGREAGVNEEAGRE
jgi:hypothetical protein